MLHQMISHNAEQQQYHLLCFDFVWLCSLLCHPNLTGTYYAWVEELVCSKLRERVSLTYHTKESICGGGRSVPRTLQARRLILELTRNMSSISPQYQKYDGVGCCCHLQSSWSHLNSLWDFPFRVQTVIFLSRFYSVRPLYMGLTSML